MAEEKPSPSDTGFSGTTSNTDSSFLSFLSSMNGTTAASTDAPAPSLNNTLSFSSMLPTSGSIASTNSSSNMMPPASTALPIGADIDQLMRSLSDSVDTSHVSNEDIDKLLGSINVNFPSDMVIPGSSASNGVDNDPLASLSRDLGIDLSTSVSLPRTKAVISDNSSMGGSGGLTASTSSAFTTAATSQSTTSSATPGHQQPFMSRQDANAFHADPIVRTQAHSGLHMSSMPVSPALTGISGDNHVQRPGLNPQLQQGIHYRPSPPRSQQHSVNMQQRALATSQSPSQVGSKQAATPRASPGMNTGALGTASVASQSPQHPHTPMQMNRLGSRQRSSFSEAAASPGLSGAQSLNSGPGSESPSLQVRPPRQVSASQGHSGQNQQGMRGQQQAGMSAGTHMRPQQRPQVSFGPATGASSVDPSRWLVETMSKLPSDQQERLAGLFRGLQSKTIDFPTFMRDAKVIMGTKFQDLLVLMHNQGMRPANMAIGPQQQQNQQASSPMARPNNPFSGLNVRPGIPHMSSASLQMPTSQGIQRNSMQGNPLVGQGSVPDQQILDSSRNNMALMRQLLASQQAHGASTGGSGNTSVSKDTLSASLPASAYQNSQSAMMAAAAGSSSQDASVGNMGSFPAASMGGVTPETLIARWRQIILNPVIPVEQLARLSMQLSSFGNLLASSTGPMAHMSEEARNQQFVQITKLQALIAQRQFARGSQAQKSASSQPESRPESPKPEKNKEAKKKVGAKATKEGGMPARPKKRASESRRSGSPAPRPLSKKQKTGASTQSEADMEALTTQLALAGPSLSLDNISSISAVRGGPGASGNAALVAGLTALQADEKGTPASYVDADSGDDNDSNVDYEDEDDTPISTSLIRGGISRTESLGTGTYNSDAEQDGNARGKDGYKAKGREREVDSDRARAGDKLRDKEKAALKDTQRKYKEKREKDRGGAGGGGDVFSIDDVIGYTGVDLREESEIILGSSVHDQQDAYKIRGAESGYTRNASPLTRVIDGVEVSRTRSRETSFANSSLLEVLVSRSCKRLGIRAVSADVVPYLSLALQERLRSFMEIVSAAAYHRTKTQTLPPPPLDPSIRLPLYKITPHLDVKKQLLVLERIDKMKEQNRQKQLKEREQSNTMDPQQQADGEIDGKQGSGSDERRKLVGSSAGQGKPESALGASASSAAAETASTADNNGIDQQQSRQTASIDANDASKAAAGAKRSRKREDSATESPAYTSKNMPDDIRNKISNQTALRAAGGVRKSWMNASSANWLGGASAGKPSARPAAGSRIAPQHPADTADSPGSATPQADDSLRSGGGLPLPNSGSQMARRTASISSASGSVNNISSFVDVSGSTRSSLGHRRNRSSASNASDFDSVAVVSPAPEGAQTPLAQPALLRPPFGLLPHRSTTLAAPLLVTVRDCLFSLERERLGSARAGRGSGDRVLIQAYTKYLN